MTEATLIVALVSAAFALAAVVYARRGDTRAARLENAERRRELNELLRIADRVIHLTTEVSDNAHERVQLAREARGLLVGSPYNLPATGTLSKLGYAENRDAWTNAANASRSELLAILERGSTTAAER